MAARFLLSPASRKSPANFEPLGLPRANHYDLGVRIFQDRNSVAILYQYDNRWRVIWTDGRPLPKVLDGGVEINGEYHEQRWMGYSVGKWRGSQMSKSLPFTQHCSLPFSSLAIRKLPEQMAATVLENNPLTVRRDRCNRSSSSKEPIV